MRVYSTKIYLAIIICQTVYKMLEILWLARQVRRDFPVGTVVKNSPANAGGSDLSPGPGRSHVPQSN